MVRVEKNEGKLFISCDYNPKFISRIRKMNGEFDKKTKKWVVDAFLDDDVRELLREIFFTDGTDEMFHVRIKIKEKITSKTRESIYIANHQICRTFGRDDGAMFNENAMLMSGDASSGGSAKNYNVHIDAGAVILMKNLSALAIDEIRKDENLEILKIMSI